MMLIVTEAASIEVAEAAAWYQGRKLGLGVRFLAAVDCLLEQIAEHPMRFCVVHAQKRRALVPGFPYCVFYRAYADRVVVMAVMHGRRDPRAWQQRGS